MSLIIHYGDCLDCGHYVSDVFNANTGILWLSDDDDITEIGDFPELVYTRESHKKTQESNVRL